MTAPHDLHLRHAIPADAEPLARLINDESGATAVEYGLIAALIAIAAVTIMGTSGINLSSTFNKVAGKL